MTSPRRPGPTLGYLTKRFPRLSETFILDEILGLESAGVPLRLFAIANPMEDVTQPDVVKVASPVTYLRVQGGPGAAIGKVRTLSAHIRLAVAHPVRYRTTLRSAWADRATSGNLRPFVDAGRLAVELRRTGAIHLHAAFAHRPASIARYVHQLTGLPFSFAAHAKDLYLSDVDDLAVKAHDASFVLTCSGAAETELKARLGTTAKVVLAYHGVDTDRFRPAPHTGADAAPLRVLAVGRLVAKKGYPVLLNALRQLADGGRTVTCRIAGGGPDRAALTALAGELGLDQVVTFVGACTHQEVAAEFARADVFVQASVVLSDGDRDGIPNALLEAMASGLPVVASAVSGIPEAVDDGVSGLLVAPGDAAGLAGALARLRDDAGLARSLASGARAAVVTRFDRRVLGQRLAPLFWPQRPHPLSPPVVPASIVGQP